MENLKYYEKIMLMPGQDEAKEIIKKWDNTLKKLNTKNINPLKLLPNLLLKSKSGAGKTYFCDCLSEYLNNHPMIDFYGDVKFFEFYFSYCEPKAHLNELSRFAQQLKYAAGYRNAFSGVIAIDVSQWIGHITEVHFLMFLDYISMIDSKCCIVFIAEDLTFQQAAELEKIIRAFCRIRSVDFSYPSNEILMQYIQEKLSEYNFTLDQSAKDLLSITLDRLMNSQYFDGYKTINRLCLDIAFELLGQSDNSTITEKELSYFSQDSEFIKTVCTTPKIKSIGFDAK